MVFESVETEKNNDVQVLEFAMVSKCFANDFHVWEGSWRRILLTL